jgi:hypothetical protein
MRERGILLCRLGRKFSDQCGFEFKIQNSKFKKLVLHFAFCILNFRSIPSAQTYYLVKPFMSSKFSNDF